MSKIKLDDTMLSVFSKMSEGNPGAMSVLANLVKYGRYIDPYAESFMYILMLDERGIYGSRIWILYKDICGESIVRLMFLIRACQLGIVMTDDLFKPDKDFDEIMLSTLYVLPNMNTEIPGGVS